jgi:hypothetical protein
MVKRSHVGHFRGRDASYDDSLVDHDVRRKPIDLLNPRHNDACILDLETMIERRQLVRSSPSRLMSRTYSSCRAGSPLVADVLVDGYELQSERLLSSSAMIVGFVVVVICCCLFNSPTTI